MTHHTDTERQAFEAVASDDGKWPKAIERDAKGNYLLLTTANGWMWWQAARRAPAVPDQSIIEAVDGWFARNTCLGGCSDKDVAELAAIFAAAPQPPEADHIPDAGKMVAAPVQLPENLREGEPYDNPAFEALARELGVWGTAQSAVCAQFWLATTPAQSVVLPEPALYVSGGQLEKHCDPEDTNGGSYIPARKTAAGLFTAPLYTEQQVRDLLAAAKVERKPLTADEIKEPKNGDSWRVEWWNESCRMMLPADKALDSFRSYKNGTMQFTLKQRAHGIGKGKA